MKKLLYFTLSVITLLLISYFYKSSPPTKFNPNFFKQISLDNSRNFNAWVTSLAFNNQSTLLAIGYESGKVDIFDVESDTKYMSVSPIKNRIKMLNFSHDGKYLIVGSDSWNNFTSYIYDLDKKSLYIPLKNAEKTIFTSDDKYLLTQAGRKIQVYDIEKKEFIYTYYSSRNSGATNSFTLNKQENMIALGKIKGIELLSFKRTSWYEKFFGADDTITISSLSEVFLPCLPDLYDRCSVNQVYFRGNELISLTYFGAIFPNSTPLNEEYVDFWSLPSLQKKSSLKLQADSINDSILTNNEKYIVVTSVKRVDYSKRGPRGEKYFAEQIDLETKTSKITAKLQTNSANIVKWPELTDNPKKRELVFIEHAHTKLLLRVGESPTYDKKTKYQKNINEYLDLPFYYKALVMAEDTNGEYTGSFKYNKKTFEEAKQEALENCQKNVYKMRLNSHCKIIYENELYLGN